MPRIYISGVSGSGKTAACRLLIEKHPEIHFINSSRFLLDLLGLKDSREIKNAPTEILEKIRREVLPEIFLKYPNLVVDGHLNLTREMVNCFDAFLSIEATPEKILSNRHSEPQRIRPLTIEDIEKEISFYHSKLKEVSIKFSIHPHRVFNRGNLEDLSKDIYTVYLEAETNKKV